MRSAHDSKERNLPTSAARTAFDERRRCPRFPTAMPITLIVGTEGRPVAHRAATADFSNLGARIRTTLGLNVGEAVGMVAYQRTRETVACRVVWIAKPQPDGWREAGLAFLSGFDS